MQQRQETKLLQRELKKFRLSVARETIRNALYVAPDLVHMQAADHIAELCDKYALRLIINRVAMKHQSTAYIPDLFKTGDGESHTPAHLYFLWGEYPFVDDFCFSGKTARWQAAFNVMEQLPAWEPELLACLYEQLISDPLVINEQYELHIPKASKTRANGAYFTPPDIVRLCFDASWEKDLSALISRIKEGSKNADDLKPGAADFPKICDPACGSGNFLLGGVRWLRQHGLNAQDCLRIIGDSLYGMDVDARAVSLCRISLVLLASELLPESTSQQLESLYRKIKKHIIAADTIYACGSSPASTNLQKSAQAVVAAPCAARAMPGIAPTAHPINVGASRPNWWPGTSVSFDLVITNPPYLSFGSRNQPKLSESHQRYLRLSFPDSSEYKIRLNSIFQDLCLRLARQGGAATLLVPDAFLTGQFYTRLRQYLITRSRPHSFIELPESAFQGPTVGRWCIASYIKTEPQEDDVVDLCSTVGKSTAQHYSLPMSIFIAKDRQRFRLIFNDDDRDLAVHFDKMAPLSTWLKGHTGMRSRVGQKEILAWHNKGSTWRKGLASGSSINPFSVAWDGAWLNTDKQLLFAGGHNAEIVERPKLLIRQTGDRLVAAVDLTGLYHLNNVHTFSANSQAGSTGTLYFFSGLLNSHLWLYLYQAKSREGKRPLAQIDIEMVESLPVTEGERELIFMISWLAQALHQKLSNAAGGPNPAKQSLDLLSFLRRSIDRLVYRLYGLSERQVKHIEDRDWAQAVMSPLPSASQVTEFMQRAKSSQFEAALKALILPLALACLLQIQAEPAFSLPLPLGKASGQANQAQNKSVRDKWAVLVGINSFQDPVIPGLRYSVKNAVDLSNLLKDPLFGRFLPDHVVALSGQAATRASIKQHVQEEWLVKKALPNDLILLYFSTRALASADGKDLYLCAFDTLSSEKEKSGLSLTELLKDLKQRIQSRHILCLLDVSPVATESGALVSLVELAAKSGVSILAASATNEPSADSPSSTNSLFAQYLGEGIKAGGGTLTLKAVADYVARSVAADSQRRHNRAQFVSLALAPDAQDLTSLVIGQAIKSTQPARGLRIGHPLDRLALTRPDLARPKTASAPFQADEPEEDDDDDDQPQVAVDFGSYITAMKQAIQAKWQKPKGFDNRRVVTVFTIMRDGRIVDASVIETSGNSSVDQTALDALRAASPLPALPPGSPRSVQIRYQFDWTVTRGQ